jgi:purine catabolism regulator
VAGDTERRLAGDVLAAVIAGDLAGPELARRLEPLGLVDQVAALVIERPGNGRSPAAPLESALAAALHDESTLGLVASTGPLTCALVAGLAEDDLFTVAERVGQHVVGDLGADIIVGVGRAVSAGDAKRAFHEARCALEALTLGLNAEGSPNGASSNGSAAAHGSAVARVATYKDLGSFQLLLSLQDDEALRLFCDSILGPIEAGDGHYGGELMRSLEAFIEENGQWERAARRLYCHRHTLRYRIRRVEELTGRNLGSARDRIEFWLALRGRELVK